MSSERSILIVDPDPGSYYPLSVRFKACDYAVRVATSAQEALASFGERPYSLVVMDLQLPDAEGLCLLAMLRRLHPRLLVLVLTGDDSLESTIRALRLGVAGYLLKPADLEQVLFCVGEIVKEAVLATASGRSGSGWRRPNRPRRAVHRV